MDWFKPTQPRPDPCWSCLHYEARIHYGILEHRCHISQPGFPAIGNHCPGYIYEPGSDPQEAAE